MSREAGWAQPRLYRYVQVLYSKRNGKMTRVTYVAVWRKKHFSRSALKHGEAKAKRLCKAWLREVVDE